MATPDPDRIDQLIHENIAAMLREEASEVATRVLDHIDSMYPAMWQGVPQTARLSIRNIIIREVLRMHSGPSGEA